MRLGMPRHRIAVVCAALATLLLVGACGGNSSAPATPTPVATSYTLSGTVSETSPITGVVSDVRIDVLDGPNAGRSAMSDSGGRYTMSGLSSGMFQLRASKSGYVRAERNVTLSSNTTLDLTVVRACFIAGTVREGANAVPSFGATVKVVNDPGGASATAIVSGTTSVDGSYRLDGIPCGPVRRLRVEKNGFQPLELSVPINGETYQDVTLAPI
jgi:Carboxypeptidase regulatory-like domain